MDAVPFEALQQYLDDQPAGPISEVPTVGNLLAGCWDALDCYEGGMAGYKLLNRMEKVSWQPPILSFSIERHGGTVLGSTRAELQHWEVDLEKQTATIVKTGHRQLSPMAKRVYVQPMAEELLQAILAGKKDERLIWHGEDEVVLRTSFIFPRASGFRMTVGGRRKRLREAVASVLRKEGWERVNNDTFRRKK